MVSRQFPEGMTHELSVPTPTAAGTGSGPQEVTARHLLHFRNSTEGLQDMGRRGGRHTQAGSAPAPASRQPHLLAGLGTPRLHPQGALGHQAAREPEPRGPPCAQVSASTHTHTTPWAFSGGRGGRVKFRPLQTLFQPQVKPSILTNTVSPSLPSGHTFTDRVPCGGHWEVVPPTRNAPPHRETPDQGTGEKLPDGAMKGPGTGSGSSGLKACSLSRPPKLRPSAGTRGSLSVTLKATP